MLILGRIKSALGWIAGWELIQFALWLVRANDSAFSIPRKRGGTNMKQKLNAKDFILIGVLTALMWIICMVISTAMSVAGPVTNVFYPSVVALPNGIVMMLLLAKVPKKGVLTICAAIQAILFLLVGAFWFIPIGLVIGGVLCDFLVMNRKEITMKSMMAAYALFSALFAFSAICPIKFLQSAFVGAMEKNNIAPEYIQGMLNITSVPMLVVIVAAGLVGGLLGGLIGQKALKKHFIKAGLVSVK